MSSEDLNKSVRDEKESSSFLTGFRLDAAEGHESVRNLRKKQRQGIDDRHEMRQNQTSILQSTRVAYSDSQTTL